MNEAKAAIQPRPRSDPAAWFRANWPIVAVLVGGLAVRILWMLWAAPEPVSDFAGYRLMGDRFLESGGLVDSQGNPSAYYFPVTPVLLAVLMLVSDELRWLSLAMIVLSSAAIVLIWALARRLGLSDRVALVAALIVAFLPHLVVFSPVLATEHPFTVAMLAALVVALGGGDRVGIWRWVAVGTFAGLATLTRGDGLFYLPVVLGIVALGRPGSRWQRLRRVAIAGLVALVFIGGWYTRNVTRVDPSAGLSTVGGINFYFAHNSNGYGWSSENRLTGLENVEANRVGYELAWEYIKAHPTSIFESMYEGTRALYSSSEYAWDWSTSEPAGTPMTARRKPVPQSLLVRAMAGTGSIALLTLAAVSLFTVRSWPTRLLWVIPPLVIANWAGFTIISHAKPRFRYVVDVLLAIPVAVVIGRLVSATKRTDASEEPNVEPIA